MNQIVSFLKFITWPLVVLILGILFSMTLDNYLLDRNKIEATTNAANCQIAISKENISDEQKPLICKYIFDSARRD